MCEKKDRATFYVSNMDSCLSIRCFILYLITCLSHCLSIEEILVTVNRTLSADTYQSYKDNTTFVCREEGTSTYIVGERQCINDEDLISSKPNF